MLNRYHPFPGFQSILKKQLVVAVASAAALISVGSFASDNTVSVDINAQRTDKALLELAEEAGVQIIFSPNIAKKNTSSSIRGNMTLTMALEKILSGTGLTYNLSSDGSFVIKEKDGKEKTEEIEEIEEVEEIIVTGSAIRNVEPTSKMDIYTSEDFDKMGISSVEDFLRKLPQNFSNLNSFTTTENANSEGGREDSLNTAAANLFGLGTDSTLILINGRRTAESASYEGGVVNISNLPLSSIERVEVLLDGASARYGSDAIGGVINFITKKDYVGMETKLRVERGLNGGDKHHLSQLFGFSWGSGDVTGVLAYEERESVSTFKSGHVTDDQTYRGGHDWRNPFGGLRQPGSISERRAGVTWAEQCAVWDVTPPALAILFGFSGPGWCEVINRARTNELAGAAQIIPLGSLPVGHDGVNWQLSDLSPANALEQSENLRYSEGTTTENISLSLSINQNITDYISLYSELLYSESEASSKGSIFAIGGGAVIPSTNAFNNTGLDLISNYAPIYETQNGDLPSGTSLSEQERIQFNLGLNVDLPFRDWLAQLNWRYSRDRSEVESIRALVNAAYGEDLEPTGNEYLDKLSQQQQQVYFRFLELLASSDPDEAINLFGNGTVQSPYLSEIYGPRWTTQPDSVSKGFSGNVDGLAFTLPAGDARFGFGFEYNTNYRDYSNDYFRNADFELTQEPTRDDGAVYAELHIPAVSEEQGIPLIQSLDLNISGRWEEFSVKDGYLVTGVDTTQTPAQIVTEPVDEIKFSHTSPRIGMKWQLSDEFAIRASWGESFSAPHFVQLLGQVRSPIFVPNCVPDINHPDPNVAESCGYYVLGGGNPDLKPEVASTLSYGFEWLPRFIDGLLVAVNIRETEFENRVGSISQIGAINDDGAIWPEQFVVRKPNGDIDYINQVSANFAKRVSETVDLSVRYNFSTDIGDFQASLNAVYTGELYDRFRSDLPKDVRVGTKFGPQDWVGRFAVNWQQGGYGVNMNFNYQGSYINNYTSSGVIGAMVPAFEQKVDDYWTLDVTGHYEFGDGWRISAGATDITGSKPPFYDSAKGYDMTRWSPVGRLIYAEVTKKFDF